MTGHSGGAGPRTRQGLPAHRLRELACQWPCTGLSVRRGSREQPHTRDMGRWVVSALGSRAWPLFALKLTVGTSSNASFGLWARSGAG